MVIIQALLLTGLFIKFGAASVRKYPLRFRAIAVILACFTAAGTITGIFDTLPAWKDYLLPLLTQGAIAGAMFIAVMFAGALPNTDPIRKRIMPVRGELSIDASILTLGHISVYAGQYFKKMFGRSSMAGIIRVALIGSVIMTLIMLPLFATSFPSVRRHMAAHSWKRLQRYAYPFYFLLYLHIMLLNGHSAACGKIHAIINVSVYSVIFIGYAVLRLQKAFPDRSSILTMLGCIGISAAMLCVFVPAVLSTQEEETVTETTAVETENLQDGNYRGNGNGYNGKVTVSVTVSDGKIANIELVSSSEDEPYLTEATTAVFPEVIRLQSADVDVTTSATSTVKALEQAIGKALKKATAQDQK